MDTTIKAQKDSIYTEETQERYSRLFSSGNFRKLGEGSARTLARQKSRLGLVKQRQAFNHDPDFYKAWTDELAWILGLIWTDGFLAGNQVYITSKDKEMLDDVNAFIKSDRPLNKRKDKDAYDVVIQSKGFVQFLKSIGYCENKTFDITYPSGIPNEFKAAFFRGLIDGDGCVVPTKKKGIPAITVQLCGASKIHEGVQNWLFTQGIFNTFYKKSRDNAWKIYVWRVADLKNLYSLMYPQDDVLCLHRKRLIFKTWLDAHNAYSEELDNKNPKCQHCNSRTYLGAERANGTKKYVCCSCKKCTSVKPDSLLDILASYPSCKYCGHDTRKTGFKNGRQSYGCKACGRRMSTF